MTTKLSRRVSGVIGSLLSAAVLLGGVGAAATNTNLPDPPWQGRPSAVEGSSTETSTGVAESQNGHGPHSLESPTSAVPGQTAAASQIPTPEFTASTALASPAAFKSPLTVAAPQVYSKSYRTVFPKVTSKALKLTNGRLTIFNPMVEVTVSYALPNGSGPETSFELSIDRNLWRFKSFSGLELKNSAGVTLAKAKATASKLTIVPTKAAAQLKNVKGKFSFFVQAEITPKQRTGVLNLISPSGAKLGSGSSYKFDKSQPNITGGLVTAGIVAKTELVMFAKPQYVDAKTKFDPKKFSVVVRPITKGALPICDKSVSSATARWIDKNRLLASGSFTAKAKCSGTSMTLTLPSGVKVPAGTTGVRVEGPFVIDRPLTTYKFEYKIKYGSKTVTVQRSGKSGVLAGVAAGERRPARTKLTMKQVLPKSGRLLPGNTLDYQLVTKSAESLRTAYGVVTKQTLPSGVDFVSASNSGKYNSSSRTITWPARDLKAGQSSTYKVRVKVRAKTTGTLKSQATNTGSNTCYKGDTTGSVCSAKVSAPMTREGISLEKKKLSITDTNKNGVIGDAGDSIKYGFDLTNTGNTPEASIKITDSLLGVKNAECLSKPLAAGKTVRCKGTFSHTITAAEAKQGKVVNKATARTPGGHQSTDQETVPAFKPAFSFTKKTAKVVDTNNNDFMADAGDTIHYEFTVRNTGNSTIKTIKLTDGLLGIKNVECLKAPLKPGASATCVGDYRHVITDADTAVGQVVNTATATSPGAPTQTGKETTRVSTPGFAFTKNARKVEDTNQNGFTGDAGDTIHYEFTVRNTGDQNLETIKITDSLLGITDAECLDTPLKPEATATCLGEYKHVITKEDAAAGTVENIATATTPGIAPKTGKETTPTYAPGFDFTKKTLEIEDTNKNGLKGDVGDRIHYQFTVRNTGNSTLETVKITDELLGITDAECLSGPLEAIKKGSAPQEITCTDNDAYWYTITEKDAATGTVENTAIASAPGAPTQTGKETTPVSTPGFAFTKNARKVEDTNQNGFTGDAGDTIHYEFTVRNTGDQNLETVKVTDKLLGIADAECLDAPLKPEATATCLGEYKYVITKEDAATGTVENVATATTPSIAPKTGKETTPTYAPGFDFTKKTLEIEDANGDGITGNPGDRIHYQFAVRNTGNSTLETIKITDKLLGITDVECLAGPIEAGSDGSISCTDNDAYWYTITEKDAATGTVENTATATTPGAPPQTGKETTPVRDDPEITSEIQEDPEIFSEGLAETGIPRPLTLLLVVGVSVIALGASLMYSAGRRRM